MSLTVWGPVAKLRDAAAKYDRYGRITEAYTFDEFELELPDEFKITVDHEPNVVVGELGHAELDKDGVLHAVAVVDERLAGWDGDLFWSGEWIADGAPRSKRICTGLKGELTGLSIVQSPAQLFTRGRPLRSLTGDYRHSPDRQKWEWSWVSKAPLVARALEHRSSGSPTRIYRKPEVVRVRGGWLVDDEYLVATPPPGARAPGRSSSGSRRATRTADPRSGTGQPVESSAFADGVSDRRYSTSAWQKTRRAILQRDGYVCQIRGPRCTGRATSVHHVAPSSQRPDLFWDSGNLTAACQTCNAGGGRRIAVENGCSTMLQLAQAIEQLSHRVYALGERVTQLEDAQPEHTNVDTTPVHAVPRIY